MEIKIKEIKDPYSCFHCGECCKMVPCIYGRKGKDGCSFLVPYKENGLLLYSCGIYDEIIKQPDAYFTPAFGAGCCRNLFNPIRDNIMEKLKVKKTLF